MSRQAEADATEKSLADFLGMVVVIAALMAMFIYYFLKHENSYVDVALTSAATTFSSQLVTIHSQWLMHYKPSTVLLKEENSAQQRAVRVNQFGWPDSQNLSLPCADIWQQVMAQPLKVLNYPVVIVEIKAGDNAGITSRKICRYLLTDTLYFDYDSGNGKVIKAN